MGWKAIEGSGRPESGMARIGIMQGRLVPPEGGRVQCFPRETWPQEFELAALAGLDCVEWVYDLHGADANPIATDDGVDKVRHLSERYGIPVRSMCADYFMDRPLLRASASEMDERLGMLEWLLGRGHVLGISRVVVPFVDVSSIETDAERDVVCEALEKVLPAAERHGIEIHLETSLSPVRFAEMLARLPHPLVKVNYDSGNSSSLGYDPRDEFAAYGNRIGSVHIKDRVLGGGTVPLGAGDADFKALAECLKGTGYAGDLILQVARGTSGDEVNWARQNREYVVRRGLAG
jgi:L-ribulose-5-phosphate 3-epimerase